MQMQREAGFGIKNLVLACVGFFTLD